MSTKKEEDPNVKLDALIKTYMEHLSTYSENINPELEVKFGTKGIKSINKSNFNNVIKSLLNFGFTQTSEEQYLLRTSLEFNDKKLEQDNKNIRFEINGLKNIQNYCITNQIPEQLDGNHQFIEKQLFTYGGDTYFPIDFPDYNFRVTYNIENKINSTSDSMQKIIQNWKTYKKNFRYLKRYRYSHRDLPFGIDLSIVKSTIKKYGKLQSTYTLRESDIFNNIETYEIEIELLNSEIGIAKKFTEDKKILQMLKKTIKYILIGIQDSYYPVGFKEQTNVRNEYYLLINKHDYKIKPVLPLDFIGPSSVTLQIENLQNTQEQEILNYNVPNIRSNYTVTDKADGSRKLLFINSKGMIYFINTSMNIEFTGSLTNNEEIFNSILDGEHITNDKSGKFINLYMAFDVYFINKKNVTGFPFIKTEDIVDVVDKEDADSGEKATKKPEILYRLSLLNSLIVSLRIKSIVGEKAPFIQIDRKKFYSGNVFSGSNTILTNIENGLYKYNTDGLIFTPSNKGVANDKIGFAAPNFKTTWNASFKWKPPIYNTIDFLISIKTDKTGQYYTGNKFSNGINMSSISQIQKFHTLILRVGFDEKKHGYINPCQNIIDDRLPKQEVISGKNDYKPVQFYPTNPVDNNAGICNIELRPNSLGELKMFTLDNEEIEDNSIVEFKYDSNMEEGWRWIPLRVRYDKTNELRSGLNNFGNAYNTANNVWYSIHYPVTNEMISSGKDINLPVMDNDIYYNKSNKISQTRSLRDFHNLYIKQTLLNKLSNEETVLIDYAVGKGGDIPKWINSNIRFALGIDISRDNIDNRIDGACARYLNYCKKFTRLPSVMFLNGDSSVNIRSGNAFVSDKSRQIINAIFGNGSKDITMLGKGVYKNYGVANEGFNISSIQFAIHYMFENRTKLHSFMKNLCECTKINGYFVGTCYDGTSVFNLLNKKDKGESINLYKNGEKIWEITRQYTKDEFLDNESSLGYAIDVYQETINKIFREYLVNYKFLKRLLENYGFVELNSDELQELGLKSSTGMFSEMFSSMKTEISTNKKKHYGNSENMSEEEKTISFLNRYFIFKKNRNVDADKIKDQYTEPLTDVEKQMAEEILESLKS
tara:strand:+ start:2940 stop:6251 length:3312 start_codon:yes stop_codon:yes gene_type:complete